MLGKRVHFDNLYLEEPRQYGGFLMYQVGDLNCKGEYQVDKHIQHCHEITYVVSGSGTFEKDGKFYRVKSGDIFLSPYESTHTVMSSEGDPIRYYYLGFMFDKTHPDYEKYAGIERLLTNLKTPLIHDDIRVHNLFSIMFNEIVMDYENKGIVIRDCIELLLLFIERSYFPKPANTKKERISEKKEYIVYEIINYIDNNIFNIQALTEISQYVGYSYAYISQVFSNTMGISLSMYYQNSRFQKAVELLSGGIGITQVADMLGYDSLYSFSRAFKKHFGLAPSNYVKTVLKK